nr:MAG TPA: hypothetical protein [Caudoviricetes sp.]
MGKVPVGLELLALQSGDDASQIVSAFHISFLPENISFVIFSK